MKIVDYIRKYLDKNLLLGTTISLLTAGFLLYLDKTNYRIPSSPGIFATVIILVTFHLGLLAGIVSAVIAWVYTAIHFSLPGNLFSYNHADLIRIVMWGFIFPFQGAMIGVLKERLLKKIDSEKLLQQKLVAASKMQAIGEMAAGIAHEINTPLGAIVLNAEMIVTENESLALPSKNIEKRAMAISETGHRISKIIDGLKYFSREASGDSDQAFSIGKLITIALDLCNERFKNHGIQVTIKEEFLETLVYGQAVQLSQAVLNLLNNSFDAIKDLSEKWIRIETVATEKYLQLSFTDSGSGIPKDVIGKIFQPFFTTKDIGKGTGLGLSISAGIIQSHGGSLTYDEKFRNTRFVIRLPLARAGGAAA